MSFCDTTEGEITCGRDLDTPLSILGEEINEFSRVVLGDESNLPFWIKKERAIHQAIYRIMNLLNHIERHGNSWAGYYPAWRE